MGRWEIVLAGPGGLECHQSVLLRRGGGRFDRGEGDVTSRAELGVMGPQAKEPGRTRSWKRQKLPLEPPCSVTPQDSLWASGLQNCQKEVLPLQKPFTFVAVCYHSPGIQALQEEPESIIYLQELHGPWFQGHGTQILGLLLPATGPGPVL